MEKYEYTTAMLVKVVRVENKAHTGFVRLKQDFMALGIEYEIELTTRFSHWSGQTQAKERYEYTTAMLTRVENTALARRSWLQQVPLLLDIYYQAVYVIVPVTWDKW